MFHTVPVLTMFHAPPGPALISESTTAQSCLPSWQKYLFYSWVSLSCISGDLELLGILMRRG